MPQQPPSAPLIVIRLLTGTGVFCEIVLIIAQILIKILIDLFLGFSLNFEFLFYNHY